MFFFTIDTMFANETRARVNSKLEICTDNIESRGSRSSKTKTKHIECRLNESRNRDRGIVELGKRYQ